MMGSVPFVDAMYVTDLGFDPGNVFYMPASSHIPHVKSIMADWLDNFLSTNVSPDEPVTVMTIDEVVSGGSATRVNRAVKQAINRRRKNLVGEVLRRFWDNDPEKLKDSANYLNSLLSHREHDFLSKIVEKKVKGIYESNPQECVQDINYLKGIVVGYFDGHIKFRGIGIEDSKDGNYVGNSRNREYLKLVDEKTIFPISVGAILTMDNPIYCPVQYETLPNTNEADHVRYSPIVDSMPNITSEYKDLLNKLSKVVGGRSNPKPISVERALFSGDYLSEKFGGRFTSNSTQSSTPNSTILRTK